MSKSKMSLLMSRVRAGKVTKRDKAQLRKNAAKARRAKSNRK